MTFLRGLLESPDRHLSSDRLTTLALANASGRATNDHTEAEAHLRRCRRCRDALAEVDVTLAALRAEAAATAATATSPDRLARQRRRLQRRLTAFVGPPARVLRFPRFADAMRPSWSELSAATRWLAVAATAGLVVGIGIGQFVDVPTGATDALGGVERANAPSMSTTQPADARETTAARLGPLGDEQLMAEVEAACSSPRVATLVALDGLTPRLRDVAVDVR